MDEATRFSLRSGDVEKRARLIDSLLTLFTSSSTRKQYLDGVAELIQSWSGCRCVGIRVLDAERNIPYEAFIGFSLAFWESENWLSVERDQCACIRIITGNVEPQDAACMTPGGSFRCGNTFDFVAGLSEGEAARFRGVCVSSGYASVAVVPFRWKGKVLGAFHLADEREDKVPAELIETLELVGPLVGEVVHRFDIWLEEQHCKATESIVGALLRLSIEEHSLEQLISRALSLISSVSWLAHDPSLALFLTESVPDVLLLKLRNGVGEPNVDAAERVPFGVDLSGKAAQTSQVQWAEHLETVPGGHTVVHRHYCVPMASNGTVLGVLSVRVSQAQLDSSARGRERAFLVACVDALAGVILRCRTMQQLEDSESRFRSVVETALEAIVCADNAGTIVFSNRAVERILGYSSDGLVGQPLTQLMPERFRADHEGGMTRVLTAGVSKLAGKTLEVTALARDGSEIPIELSIATWTSGEKTYFTGILRDATELKRAEQALRHREERFRLLVDSSPYGILAYDTDLRYTIWNPAMERISGLAKGAVLGQLALEVFPFLDVVGEANSFRDAVRGKASLRGIMPFDVPETGKNGYFESSHFPLRNAGGRIVGGIAFIRDVSERVRAEDASRESEHKFKRLAENAQDIIYRYRLKPDPGFEYVSPAVTAIMGYTPEEYYADAELGVKTVHPDDRLILQAAMKDPGSLGGPIVLRWMRKDGTLIWTEQRSVLVSDESGDGVAIEGIVRDISEQRRGEEDLARSLEKLQTTLEEVIESMAMTVEIRDPYTAGHQLKVSELSCAIAREMGLSDDQIRVVRLSALVHDIGKINVPAEILSKPGRISDSEFKLIQAHSRVGFDILRRIDFPWPLAEIVWQHHERLDGSGYPEKLTDGAILLEARILAVADVVEAMASHRPYRPALGVEAALAEITQKSGKLYDPQVVDACVRLFSEERFRWE